MTHHEEAIALVMSRVDFVHVHQIMEQLHWVWDFDGAFRTPTEAELKAKALALLQEAVDCWEAIHYPCFPRAGGFMAACQGEGRLRLDFVLESWDAEYGITED